MKDNTKIIEAAQTLLNEVYKDRTGQMCWCNTYNNEPICGCAANELIRNRLIKLTLIPPYVAENLDPFYRKPK